MNDFQLILLLTTLHVRKPGCKPLLRSVTRKRQDEHDFTYRDGGQTCTIKEYMVDAMVKRGWIKVQPLDAWTEYLSATEAGEALVMSR